MYSRSSWIRVLSVSSFAALSCGVAACSSPTASGSSDGGGADTAAAVDAGADSMTAPETGADAGGFMKLCTMLGTPGDCPPGENLTCRSYPNPAPGKELCTRPCTAATAAVDCPPPSKGCGGMGLCAGP